MRRKTAHVRITADILNKMEPPFDAGKYCIIRTTVLEWLLDIARSALLWESDRKIFYNGKETQIDSGYLLWVLDHILHGIDPE
jgi:hypothetical protein